MYGITCVASKWFLSEIPHYTSNNHFRDELNSLEFHGNTHLRSLTADTLHCFSRETNSCDSLVLGLISLIYHIQDIGVAKPHGDISSDPPVNLS